MAEHILHIAPTPFFSDRGCHIRIQGIVRCLSELGHNNIVCTYHHGRDVSNVTTKRINTIPAYTKTSAGPSKYKLLADWRLLWLVISEYRQQRPTVIHAHLHEGLLIGLLVKLFFFWHRVPIIADMQGSLTGELDTHSAFKKMPFLRWPTHFLERVLMWLPTAIVCSNQHSLDKIRGEFSVNSNRISLAQDGADAHSSLDQSKQDLLKEQWQLPQDKILLVYSGALLASKGLTELQDVLLNIKSRNDVHSLIIGYPIENLRPFIMDKRLNECCTLTGQIDFAKLPNLLSIADIAIDPKRSEAGEGSGKMLNYLACGLPVVAFNSKNNRQFLPADTPLSASTEDMVQQIITLLDNKSLREEQGMKARQHFVEHYSWTKTRQQLSRVYCKLVRTDTA